MTPKAKSLNEKFGFMDEDLKTKNHDDIISLCINKQDKLFKQSGVEWAKSEMLEDTALEYWVQQRGYNGNVFPIGAIDIMFTFKFPSDIVGDTRSLGVEVKTYIRSMGELIRQVNLYSSYERYTKWVVVAPYQEHVSMLATAGIKYINLELLEALNN